MKKALFYFIGILLLASCNNASDNEAREAYVNIPGIDSSLNPGDDFFRYVNHIWYDTAQIPPSQAGVGAYMFMNYPQRLRLQGILDSVSKANNPAGSIEQKLGDFYASGMDTNTVNQRGYEPVKPLLARIDSISNTTALLKFVADEAKVYNNSIIGLYVGPDNKNSSMNIAHVSQAGIGLPQRDYYFSTDSQSVAIQNAYKKYLSTLFQLTGTDAATAAKNADIVYGIEKQIAASHRTNIELRDINANYNKMPVSALAKKEPNIDWNNLLNNLGAKTDSIDVSQPAYYDKLNSLLKSVPTSDWKIYLKAFTLNNYADILSQPFVDAGFEFNKVVSGQAVQKTRGEKIANAIDNSLGEALGQLYVKKYFTESAKKRALELVNNIQKAYAVRIDKLDWMSDSTKQKAKEKLFAITKKIGYPDKWRDYSKVTVEKNKYFENTVSTAADNYQFNLAKLNKPVDKTEWFTTPSTVTAYNNPSANEIVFPAAILQPPYFDDAADDALNYGGIGMVIGHEMTHTFDDQGAQFDKDGNVKNWWTKEDYAKFKAKTQQVIDLYSSFTVLDTLHIKGAMTVGENTADVSGVAVAYDAFKMTKEGHDTAKIGGFTPDQRFFISVAKIWRVKMKNEFLRLWINNNPHSPPMWRVNGPLMNCPYFYEAFHVQPGDKMYLPDDERIKIW
ncbi:peptidase M13 [Arachidicoccus ginsenosidimutans]|uniref:M13 family metallopeptidase n=1 Tax=Arachidicoccus sp. BS20 TaxID=1850526 RepID=UPI0007F05A70|nr:M13 family metallopeptidase [Arachidicoccus sp. BS20]ANI89672.1 peptidase M13 [Arachidicoccus sp. BS20]